MPRLSKKGIIVTESIRQARSTTAHSSLFFAKMPMKLKVVPSAFIPGQNPRLCIPINDKMNGLVTSGKLFNYYMDLFEGLPFIGIALNCFGSGT